MSYKESLGAMQSYYQSGVTRPYAFRRTQLKKLQQLLKDHEEEIYAALYSDLKKSKEESYFSELGVVLHEISVMLSNLKEWMKPEKVTTNLVNLPSASILYKDPRGVVLNIAPWNYPLQLSLVVVAGAIAGGNCIVLKPSELAPTTSALLAKMLAAFPETYIKVVEGDGATVIDSMMNAFRFDYIFYTGGTAVGRIIYEKAARQLIPVTLELGGKNPCIVDFDASIKVAARRIAFGKFLNVGQTCIAPDYILVHRSVKQQFVTALQDAIVSFYGKDSSESYDYGRIINHRQFDRLMSYLKEGNILFGGTYNREQLFIAPTIIGNVQPASNIMQEEIFGPILPIITYNTFEEAMDLVKQHANPLAFYLFTTSKQTEENWINNLPFGGGCINNTIVHFTNDKMPFSGVGNSGIGGYHGKYTFDTLTRIKPVLKTPTWIDPSVKYPSHKGRLGMFKRLIR